MVNGSGGFFSLHPWLCFSYFAALVLFVMVFKHPVYLAIILLSTIFLNYLLDGGKSLKKNSKFYLVLVGIIIVLNPLFSQRGATILFYFRDRPVTLESLVYGGLFALALLSILFAFLAYNRIITPDRFLYLFSSITPGAAFIITVTLRFIPLMKRRLEEIISVQKVMGAGAQNTKKQQVKEAMEMFNILVMWSLESSMQAAVSMRARGYGSGKRSSAIVYCLEKRDLFWLFFMALTGGLVLLGSLREYGIFEVYPSMDSIFPVFSWHLMAVVLFIAFPVYMEIKELIWWRFTRPKV